MARAQTLKRVAVFRVDGAEGRGKDQLNHPEGVAVDGDRIWIVDTYNHRVWRCKR